MSVGQPRTERAFLVARPLHAFVERKALPGTGISIAAFWSGLADLAHDFGERNRQLLDVRDGLQARIDAYHAGRIGQPLNLSDYESFLREIGYLLPQIDDFTIRTRNVDEEIAEFGIDGAAHSIRSRHATGTGLQ